MSETWEGSGVECGTAGRDNVCQCGHRRWLHSGDKDECHGMATRTEPCQCTEFREKQSPLDCARGERP
jgi:hypothetical protein